MFELRDDHFDRVRHLFEGERLQLLIDAVSASNSPGWLWVDDAAAPKSALLWDKTHSLYLAGRADNADFNDAVRRLSDERISRTVEVFKAYSTSEAWEQSIEAIFANVSLRKIERVFYKLGEVTISDWREHVPNGFRISEINATFETLNKLNNFGRMREEIESCWNALDDFRERGFGFCAHDETTIACWCTAEYVSAGKCGIGIETVEEYGRRGFATLTASAFAEYALAHSIAAHWDAWASNAPSVRVAEKVGFEKAEDYRVIFGEFSPDRRA